MKRLFYILFIATTILSCKQEKKAKEIEKPLSIVEKIANAHGYENWHKVKTFEFTFGGKIDDSNSGRSWVWNPKTNDVRLVRNNDTTYYNRNSMDSIAIKTDRAFINDKFWALIPFQLVGDDVTYTTEALATAPVSQTTMNKLTITYPKEGGYTPGDAYDIYFDEDYIIQEWSYRKANTKEPSLSNTFENYSTFNGLKIAQEHKKSEGDWNLLVRNIKIEIEE